MRRSDVGIILFCISSFALPDTSFAIHSITARYSVQGGVRALPDINPPFGGQLTDIKVNPLGIERTAAVARVFTDVAVGGYGSATATGNVEATSMFGSAGAGFTFLLDASNHRQSLGTDIARAEVTLSATAGWTDTIRLLYAEQPVGTLVEMAGEMALHGDLGASSSAGGCCARAKASVAIANSGSAIPGAGGAAQDTSPTAPDDILYFPGETFPVVLIGRVGTPLSLSFLLAVSGSGYANRGHYVATPTGSSVASGYSRFGSTMTWGGIKSVTNLETGEPIENWTITSDSGFDYSRPYPVPEPSTFILVGACISIRLALRRQLLP